MNVPGNSKQHFLAVDRAFGGDALKTATPRRKAVAFCNRLDRHEADIVPVARVAGARIAEPRQAAWREKAAALAPPSHSLSAGFFGRLLSPPAAERRSRAASRSSRG